MPEALEQPRQQLQEDQGVGAAAAALWELSFWAMRNDAHRERRLPGFFDREVYHIVEGRGRVILAGWSAGNAAKEEAVAATRVEEKKAGPPVNCSFVDSEC